MMKKEILEKGWPDDVSAGLIGSCTNSSYEDISRAASVIRNALEANVSAKAELMITPGSEQIRSIAEKQGLLDLFIKTGGRIYANACGPCIGQWERKDADKKLKNTIIHSFNRNFSKRTDGNPNTHAFVASPEIVAAITLAGKLSFNPATDALVNSDGKKINLPEPRGCELPIGKFKREKRDAKDSVRKRGKEIQIDPSSERLQLLKPFKEWDGRELSRIAPSYKSQREMHYRSYFCCRQMA